jgi:hypothetical protein
MKVIRIRTTMHDLMNRARESVKREDHVDRFTAKSPKLGRSSGRLISRPLACGDATHLQFRRRVRFSDEVPWYAIGIEQLLRPV